MALSNWDTLAFDEAGQPGTGEIATDDGAGVIIYKNWLYVRDPAMWMKDRGFVEPTIAQISEGDLTLSHFAIRASRGPQSSVFCYVTTGSGKSTRRMGGIGCYGYRDEVGETLAALGRVIADDDMWCTTHSDAGDFLLNLKTDERIPYTRKSLAELWVGCLPETLAAFIAWLETEVIESYDEEAKAWLVKVKAAKPFRFNQGDAYFVARGIADLQATAPGKVKAPIISRLLSK